MATQKGEDIDTRIARLERLIAHLRQKKERQKAAADDTGLQIEMFEREVAALKKGG